MAGRPSKLKDPDFCKLIAETYVSGHNTEEMAETFECHKDTVRIWVKDPRVQAHIVKLTRERIARITRKIDSEMEGRLQYISSWKLEDILKVRKEYLDRTRTADTGDSSGSSADTIDELSEAMDNDPKLAEALRALVEG